jgi:hypothetical protein
MQTFLRQALVVSGGLQPLKPSPDTLLLVSTVNGDSVEGTLPPQFCGISASGHGVIAQLSWVPVRGISSGTRSLQMLQLNRAANGTNTFQLAAKSKAKRSRVSLLLSLVTTRVPFQDENADRDLIVSEAFSKSFRNADNTTPVLRLPDAVPASVGLEYYFTVRSPGQLVIRVGRPAKDRLIYGGADDTHDELSVGTRLSSTTDSASVVIRCRERRLWVVENASIRPDGTTDWRLATP